MENFAGCPCGGSGGWGCDCYAKASQYHQHQSPSQRWLVEIQYISHSPLVEGEMLSKLVVIFSPDLDSACEKAERACLQAAGSLLDTRGCSIRSLGELSDGQEVIL